MATAAQTSHSDKFYFSMLSGVWKKMMHALKLAQVSNLSKEQALIAIEKTPKARYFAVPTADKALMQEALAAIEDPAVKVRSKAAFRDILTDPALSMRRKRLRFGILQVIKHLIKIGEVNAAEQLFLKLNKAETRQSDNLALLAKNSGLDYKRTQMLLAWQQQNQVWPADAVSTKTLANMLASRESTEFAAELLADRQKMLVPTFVRHCNESVPLTTLADVSTVSSNLREESLLPFVEPLTLNAPTSLTFSAVAAQAAPALRQNAADKSAAQASKLKAHTHKPRALAGA